MEGDGGGGGMLQLAVQSVEWTYSLYWRFSTHQRMLVWGDGFYNGPIKTTKTLHPAAELPPAASLSAVHRTQQLRELYSSLSASSAAAALRRPNSALSPEDLTESEWFYLLCLSFSFPPGVGLPGNAFANNKHVWITGANDIHTKIFSRAILAKSADIKTVVCIPLMDGVVELGTTDKVSEDIGFIQHIKSIFGAESQWAAPKQVISELSTSNSATSLDHNYNNHRKGMEKQMDSDSSTSNNNTGGDGELIMQLGPSQPQPQPDDASNNFFPSSHSQPSTQFLPPPPLRKDQFLLHSIIIKNTSPSYINYKSALSPAALPGLTQEDTHYSNTLSTLLLNQSTRWTDSSSITTLTCSTQSAFSNWTRRSHLHRLPTETTVTSQCFLKNILCIVPFLHTKHHYNHDPFKSKSKSKSCDELDGNQFLARSEKLNDKFIILRSIVPFVTKMDQASILGDTVEYLKHLRQKVRDLEAQNRQLELQRNAAENQTCPDKRKARILEDGCTNHKVLKSPPRPTSPMTITSQDNTNLQVSIIGSDGLLELQCPYREGLLLDVLLILQGMRIETTAVRSSTNNGVFVAQLWARVNENMDGKKASILEVKRAIQQIIPCID